MDSQFEITVDGRTIVAQPRPEDQATLAELLRTGQNLELKAPSDDTEGHVLAADELSVDVEGHAMTLRLPNATDAATLRRALAVGALTATVAIGGFVAGTQVAAPAAPLTAPAAITITQAAPVDVNFDVGLADQPSEAAAKEFAAAYKSGALAAPLQAPEKPQPAPNFNRHGSRRE
jgi:hypothetical protein